jgi:hypothetical protein
VPPGWRDGTEQGNALRDIFFGEHSTKRAQWTGSWSEWIKRQKTFKEEFKDFHAMSFAYKDTRTFAAPDPIYDTPRHWRTEGQRIISEEEEKLVADAIEKDRQKLYAESNAIVMKLLNTFHWSRGEVQKKLNWVRFFPNGKLRTREMDALVSDIGRYRNEAFKAMNGGDRKAAGKLFQQSEDGAIRLIKQFGWTREDVQRVWPTMRI